MSLDSILNSVIPFIIIGFAFWIFRIPIRDMWNFGRRLIKMIKGKVNDTDPESQGDLDYE